MKKIVKMIFGSHMYGLDTPNSDKDYKGIYLPELDDLLLQRVDDTIRDSTGNDKTKNTKDDVDEDWMSLSKFLGLAVAGDTMAIDMLHSNREGWELGEYGYIWEELVNRRSEFYSKNLTTYMSYVRKQAAKYGIKGSRLAAIKDAIAAMQGPGAFGSAPGARLSEVWDKLPENEHAEKIEKDGNRYYMVCGKMYQDTGMIDYTVMGLEKMYNSYGARAKAAEKNEGVDWKAVSHAIRAGCQLRDILEFGGFTYPLHETVFILGVKEGVFDYKTEVAPVLEQLVDDVDRLATESTLQDEVSKEKWDNWLLHTYYEELINI